MINHSPLSIFKLLFLVFLFNTQTIFASEDCRLTKAYKDARYDTYIKISKPYKQCKNTMKEAYYWKAVSQCKTGLKVSKTGMSCGQLVDNGSYPTERIDLAHCEVFKWKESDIANHLDQLVKASTLIMCKE